MLAFTQSAIRDPRSHIALLLLALLAVRFGSLGLYPLGDTTEARYGEVARLMLASGNWITPQSEPWVPFWAKPPLSFWAQAATMAVFGVNEFGARFSSVLFAILVGVLAWHFARRAEPGRPLHEAWLAAVILATMPLFFMMAGTVMTDMALLVCTSAAMAGFWFALDGHRRWGYVFFAALGFGLLAKGPVILALVGLPLLLWWVASPSRAQRFHSIRRRLPWIAGALLMLAIAAPWYVVAELRTPGFLDYFLRGEHVQRFLKPNWQGDLYGSAHSEPKGKVWVFFAYAACIWLPVWLASLRVWSRHTLGARTNASGARTSFDRYLVMWTLSTPIFFTLAGNTIWSYVLPSLPAFSIWLARRVSDGGPRVKRLAALTAALGTVAMAVLYFVWLPRPDVSNDRSTRDMIRAAQALVAPHPHALLVMIHAKPHSADFYSAREVIALTHDDALWIMRRGEAAAIMVSDEHMNESLMDGWLPRVLRERASFVGRYGQYTLMFHPPSPPPSR